MVVAHGFLGNIDSTREEYEKGLMEAQRAVELKPNGADARAALPLAELFA